MNESNESVFQELEEAIELLKLKFFSTKSKSVDDVLMARRALSAMLATLEDPFTNYIPPRQLNTYQSRKVETLYGIGLHVEYDLENIARVIGPYHRGPAQVPGINVGMQLLRVDDVDTKLIDIGKLNNLINGPEGTQTNLVLSDDSGATVEKSIPRGPVQVDNHSYQILDGNILYFRVAWFSGTVYQSFLEVVARQIENGIKGLIIDIRSNSGGSLISTRNIFSNLCGQDVMYYGRSVGDVQTRDRALGEHQFDLPLSILVNEATFSAGEVLSGAVKDYGRGTIVGMKTAGKGSMQNVFPLEGKVGGALRITTAVNCTPLGHIVHENGITPDIEIPQQWPELFVPDGPQNIDHEGRSYLQKLRYQRLSAQHGEDKVSPVWEAGDVQLQKALSVVREKLN